MAKKRKEEDFDEEEEEEPSSEVEIHLFGKPAWEIADLEGEDLTYETIEQIRTLGEAHKAWLERAAEIAKKLKENGWSLSGALYDIMAYKDVDTPEAKKELEKLGIAWGKKGDVSLSRVQGDDLEQEDED